MECSLRAASQRRDWGGRGRHVSPISQLSRLDTVPLEQPSQEACVRSEEGA